MSTEVKAQNSMALASVESIYKAAAQATALLASMEEAAQLAGTTLDGIYADAEVAKTSASSALANLTTIENVVGTLNWITAHGTMTSQAGGTFDPSKVYFIADPNGDYVVGGNHYSVVAEPVAEDIDDYYVLTVDESVQNYVTTHIFVDSEGLWLIPEDNATSVTSSKKILIATGGQGHTYSTAGTYIIEKIDNADTVIASFTADRAVIGREDDTRVELYAGSMRNITAEGTVPFETSTRGGGTGYQSVIVNSYGSTQMIKESDTIDIGGMPDSVPAGASVYLTLRVTARTKFTAEDGVVRCEAVEVPFTVIKGTNATISAQITYPYTYNQFTHQFGFDTILLVLNYDATENDLTILCDDYYRRTAIMDFIGMYVEEMRMTKEVEIPLTTVSGMFQLNVGNIWAGYSPWATGRQIVDTTSQDFAKVDGNILVVYFENATGSLTPTIKVDGLAAVPIVNYDGSTPSWSAGEVLALVYKNNAFYIEPVGGSVDANIAKSILELGWGEDCLGIYGT